jgi:hypothetical protein
MVQVAFSRGKSDYQQNIGKLKHWCGTQTINGWKCAPNGGLRYSIFG